MNAKLEKIAQMEGKTTYKDFRQGFAPRSLACDTDADIKMALGMAQRKVGAVAVAALETRYASTLMHERTLRRAWDHKVREDAKGNKAKLPPHEVAVLRMGAALAVRRLAGAQMTQHEVAEYAWLLCVRRERLDDAMRSAGGWLDGLCGDAEERFLRALTRARA